MKHCLTILAILCCISCSPAAENNGEEHPSTAITPVQIDVPAGTYTLDKTHASLIFRVNHLGMSYYTARFLRFDAQLQLDPHNPTASSITTTIDPTSIETDFPLKKPDFNAELRGPNWLDTEQFPTIQFQSSAIDLISERSAIISGTLTLHGVTRPIKLVATFNGGYTGHPMDPNARIGFSAHSRLKRSEYGITYGIPEAGSSMGVSDEIEVIIEAEFTQPHPAKP